MITINLLQTKMNTIKKAICGGMIGLAGLVSNGCTTEANAFGQGLVQSAIVTGVTSGTDAIVRNEFEGPRGTTIVNNNGNGNNNQLPENVIYRGGKGYQPAPGYTWVNGEGSDLRVKKKLESVAPLYEKAEEKILEVYPALWNDYNKNDKVDNKEEILPKRTFGIGESIAIICEQKGHKGDKIKQKLTDPEGTNSESEAVVGNDAYIIYWNLGNVNEETFKGVYKSEIYVNDEFTEVEYFEVK